MYSLVILLVVAGIGRSRRSCRARRCPRALLRRARDGAPALHPLLVALPRSPSSACWFAFLALRERGERRRGGVYGLGALALGGSPGFPWLPTFLYQRAHTGTPWSAATDARLGVQLVRRLRRQPESCRTESLSLHLELGLARASSSSLVFGFAGRPVASRPPRLPLTGQPRARALASSPSAPSRSAGSRAARPARRSSRATRRSCSRCSPSSSPSASLRSRRAGCRPAASALVSVLALWTTHWGAQVQRTQAFKRRRRPAPRCPRLPRRRVPRPARPLPAALRGGAELRLPAAPEVHVPVDRGLDRLPRRARRDVPAAFSAARRPRSQVTTVLPRLVASATASTGPAPTSSGLIRASGRTPDAPRGRRALVFYQSMNLLEFAPSPLTHSVPNRVRSWTPTSRRRPSRRPSS